ncbi:aldo/keto reductase [Pseudokineococcus sp. 1T1Z-3]|uniref:aldo/keto reductase n=1 Tax=Pseudokineococcus sp. 1T1Z-3 TaxID=3132745 RepID=UPI00309D93C1
MEHRPLGRSGLAVSTYSLGTMTFGAEADEATSHRMTSQYVDAGGVVLETADVYAGGLSESVVGRWLAAQGSRTRDRVVLATKGRFPSRGVEPRDAGGSRRNLRRSLERSLRRLGVDHVDLYQVHAYEQVTPMEETAGFLEDAVRSGMVGYAGLSNYTGWQTATMVALAAGRFPLVSHQPQYNLLVRETEYEIVPACRAGGLGLLPWSPLAGGWLTGKYRRDARPTGATRLGEDPGRGMEAYGPRSAREQTWEVLAALGEVAEARGATMAQVALAWLHDRPGVASVVLGVRTPEQLEGNLGAVGLHLDEAETARLEEASAPTPADYPYGPAGVAQRTRALG